MSKTLINLCSNNHILIFFQISLEILNKKHNITFEISVILKRKIFRRNKGF